MQRQMARLEKTDSNENPITASAYMRRVTLEASPSRSIFTACGAKLAVERVAASAPPRWKEPARFRSYGKGIYTPEPNAFEASQFAKSDRHRREMKRRWDHATWIEPTDPCKGGSPRMARIHSVASSRPSRSQWRAQAPRDSKARERLTRLLIVPIRLRRILATVLSLSPATTTTMSSSRHTSGNADRSCRTLSR